MSNDADDPTSAGIKRRDLLKSAALTLPAALAPRGLSAQRRRSSTDRIRVGIVGAGGIVSSTHLPGLRRMPGVEIVAVANRSLESSQRAAAELGIPLTVHVALGTDIIHMHPDASGAAIGEGSLRDFRYFCSSVARLEGGVFLNCGSAVVLPEVFLKAVALARNAGRSLDGLTTVNLDFIRHYRPHVNVVTRPTAGVGRGFHLTGHHELLIPLLAAAIVESLDG